MKTQLSNYEQQINYYKKCKAQLSQLQQQKAVAETTAVITENDLIKIEALFKQQYLNEEDKSKNSKLIEVTKAEIRSLTSIIQYTKDSIDALLKKQASPLGRFSAKLNRQNIKKELDLALQNRKHYETQLSAAIESQNICMQQSYEIDVRLHQGEKDFESALNQLACHLAFIPGILNTIHTLSKQNASIFKSEISKAIQNYISDNEHEQTQLSEQLNHNTIEALQQSYEQMQFALLNTRAALESLSINGISKRIEKCLVVATTVDTCLARLTPDSDQRFSHVFLDEAGYCSLIKAVPLTAYQCPVTFLGDHMQLQPVCTASDEVITRKKEICLWALSALYTEDALCMSMRSIFEKYNQHLMPGFDITQKYDLLFSHRFGEALARVLAGKVYSSEFKGNKDKETKIYYVNAPKIQTGKRESIIEAESIFTMLKNKKSTKTIGIITPYKNQVKLLHNKCPQLHQKTISADDIMTVHQSQGREWDCVILSVVDTSDMWFTNSNYDFGKQTINTAVSRAKDSLIIVCDYEFWIKQNHQLITDLLSIAKPL